MSCLGKSVFIECDCHMEGLNIVKDEDFDKEEISIWYLSMYTFGTTGYSTSWIQRVKHIWHILRKGYPWADQITIRNKQAQQITKYFQDNIQTKIVPDEIDEWLKNPRCPNCCVKLTKKKDEEYLKMIENCES